MAEWNRWRDRDRRLPDLSGASFKSADLRKADLRKLQLTGCTFRRARLGQAVLDGARLFGANLTQATLNGARLRYAQLHASNWYRAKGIRIDLRGANLHRAGLQRTNLRGASLRGCNLTGAHLVDTILRGTDFAASLWGNTVVSADLSRAIGLETAKHGCASSVSVWSLLQLRPPLPLEFLRGCGLRDDEILYFREQIARPLGFNSCFISYSTQDEAFAERLYHDLQAAGIRCWKWDHDARTGRGLWQEIDRAIRSHDKLVLIASEASLTSTAVNREIEQAMALEDERRDNDNGDAGDDEHVLFPVRLDDYLFDGWQHHRKADVAKKVVADARGWQSDDELYGRIRDRLVRDLKVG